MGRRYESVNYQYQVNITVPGFQTSTVFCVMDDFGDLVVVS